MADPDDDSFLEELQQKHPRARRGSWIPFVTVMLVLAGMAVSQMQNRRERDVVRSYPPSSLPPPSSVPAPPREPLHDLAAAIADLDVVSPTTDPCLVALSAPTEHLVAAENVRDMTGEDIERLRYPNGEPFGVVRVEPGASLARSAETHDRYQALYLLEAFEDSTIDMSTHTYTPSRSRGRAYLIDTTTDRVICVADVDVESIPQIRAEQRAEAEMWLVMQIHHSERRAIATGMHAVSRRD